MKAILFFISILVCIIFSINIGYAQNGIISTIAGTGVGGYSGDGGPAVIATLDTPQAVATDHFGNIYIADGNSCIRKVSTSGVITTIAGTGVAGYSGDGGAATLAQLNIPTGIAIDNSGNIYIADYVNSRIRKVTTSGIISTIAGNGTAGYSGDGSSATSAMLRHASGVAVDNSGNVYIADYINCRIRIVDPSGIITTIAGTGTGGYSGDGGAATLAQLNRPNDIVVDNSGNIIIADEYNHRIRRVSTTGIISTFAGNGTGGSFGDGVAATAAELNYPRNIAINNTGDLFIADWTASRIRKINSTDGKILSIAGNGSNGSSGDGLGFALSSGFDIRGIAVDSSNNIFLVDHSNHKVRKISQPITVWFYFDQNNNCSMDAGESFIFDPVLIAVDSNGVVIDTISATSSFGYDPKGVPGDIYTFKVVVQPVGLMISCPGGNIFSDTIRSVAGNIFTKYIGVTCSSVGGFDLAVNGVVSIFGPHKGASNIYVNNRSCNATNATVTANFSPKYNFGGSNITPIVISGNTVTWNLAALGPNPIDIYCYLGPSVSLMYGDTTHTQATIAPFAGDNEPTNNYVIVVDTVKASNDPNVMFVTPSGYIPSGTQLEYTIQFENTGTDTAFNIYIIDSLSDNVDPRSFRILSSSAKMNTVMLHGQGHNMLKFEFPYINLLDSSHHGQCDGMVKYTISTKNGLPNGTTVFNHVGIYFDNNSVVTTNSVEDIIGLPGKVSDIDNSNSSIYPDPVMNELTVVGTDKISSIIITNLLGQTVYTHEYNAKQIQINVADLPLGTYLIRINGSEVRRFVKE